MTTAVESAFDADYDDLMRSLASHSHVGKSHFYAHEFDAQYVEAPSSAQHIVYAPKTAATQIMRECAKFILNDKYDAFARACAVRLGALYPSDALQTLQRVVLIASKCLFERLSVANDAERLNDMREAYIKMFDMFIAPIMLKHEKARDCLRRMIDEIFVDETERVVCSAAYYPQIETKKLASNVFHMCGHIMVAYYRLSRYSFDLDLQLYADARLFFDKYLRCEVAVPWSQFLSFYDDVNDWRELAYKLDVPNFKLVESTTTLLGAVREYFSPRRTSGDVDEYTPKVLAAAFSDAGGGAAPRKRNMAVMRARLMNFFLEAHPLVSERMADVSDVSAAGRPNMRDIACVADLKMLQALFIILVPWSATYSTDTQQASYDEYVFACLYVITHAVDIPAEDGIICTVMDVARRVNAAMATVLHKNGRQYVRASIANMACAYLGIAYANDVSINDALLVAFGFKCPSDASFTTACMKDAAAAITELVKVAKAPYNSNAEFLKKISEVLTQRIVPIEHIENGSFQINRSNKTVQSAWVDLRGYKLSYDSTAPMDADSMQYYEKLRGLRALLANFEIKCANDAAIAAPFISTCIIPAPPKEYYTKGARLRTESTGSTHSDDDRDADENVNDDEPKGGSDGDDGDAEREGEGGEEGDAEREGDEGDGEREGEGGEEGDADREGDEGDGEREGDDGDGDANDVEEESPPPTSSAQYVKITTRANKYASKFNLSDYV